MNAPENEVTDLWERASSSLAAADTLLSERFFDYAASRAYYAAFYAASATTAARCTSLRHGPSRRSPMPVGSSTPCV